MSADATAALRALADGPVKRRKVKAPADDALTAVVDAWQTAKRAREDAAAAEEDAAKKLRAVLETRRDIPRILRGLLAIFLDGGKPASKPACRMATEASPVLDTGAGRVSLEYHCRRGFEAPPTAYATLVFTPTFRGK